MATVNQLIRQAYHSLNIISASDDMESEQQDTALFYLNEMISTHNGDGISIGYFSAVPFTMITGQGTYTIGPSGTSSDVTSNKFVSIETIQIVIDNNIVTPILKDSRFMAYETTRLVNASPGIPTEYWVEYSDTQTTITFYLPPVQAYPVIVRGKQVLNAFQLNTNISNIPDYARKYFRYALMKELCSEYTDAVWQPKHEVELIRLRKLIKAQNQIDVAVRPSSALLNSGIGDGYYLAPIYNGGQ